MKTALFSFLALLLSILSFAGPTASRGILDARAVDLGQERVALNGTWNFYDNQLIFPDELRAGEYVPTDFPHVWNETRANHMGFGYGTYSLRILVAPNTGLLALEIPQIYSSYSLWINDKEIATNGKVGLAADTYTPQWMPQTVVFEPGTDTIRLLLRVSNFSHHVGGVKDPIYMGSAELMQHHRSIAETSNLIESGLLGLVGIAFFIIYLIKDRKKVILYFALLCLTWAVRVGFSNMYIFISYMPDFSWHAMIRIEYITLFLTMIWASQYLSYVYPKEQYRILKYFLIACNVFFVAFALFASPSTFTEWITLYITFCGLVMLNAVILVLRAWVNQRMGSTFLSASIVLGLLVFAYDVFSYEGFSAYNPLVFSAGYSLVFLMMGTVLLMHVGIIKSAGQAPSRLTYKDLYKDQDVR
ncbi:MAG: 7TM-DISM domain-containing protein [Cyclobacteriaceae bacterium]|jgi:hypothetical protein|nr:hypothetical protein [Cytophagales bacterium]HNP76038.1 7TM-DISM domain-containing protein [Cyclobacteriaceae bacterium]HQQ82596.1 7TM-DISM domain-containing protein [Cyclobacteriaceae bacterium]